MQARGCYAQLLVSWFCSLSFGAAVFAQTQFVELDKSHLPREAREGWGSASSQVELGDVDGDGDLDLIVRIEGAQPRVRLHLNDGTAIFTERRNAIRIDGPMLPLADLDGDGDLDLILIPDVMLNDGKGNFTRAPGRVPILGYAAVLGDVDGDKDLDIVVGGGGLLLNNGKGVFADGSSRMPSSGFWTRSIVLADVDGDRDLDIVFGNTPSYTRIGHTYKYFPGPNLLFLNDGKGKFTDATTGRLPAFPWDYTSAMAVADVDKDGDVDLVMGNGPGKNRMFLNNGKGRFTVAPGVAGSPSDLEFMDIDADGDPDLLVSEWSSCGAKGVLYVNDGKGLLTADPSGRRVPPQILLQSDLASGDVDGDGDPDFLATSREFKAQLALNDGKGFFTNATPRRVPHNRSNSPWSMALGDVDGDGDLDLAKTGSDDKGNNIVRFGLNDGSGNFDPKPSLTLPLSAGRVTDPIVFDDVDGDGDLDMIAMVISSRGVYYPGLFLNSGKGVYSDATASRLPVSSRYPPLTWGTFTLGDVDGDRDTDLVLGIHGAANKLLLNNGKGFFSEATGRLPGLKDPTEVLALGDVDGDRDLDLVIWGRDRFGNGPVRLYSNDGKGKFTDVTAGRMPTTDNVVVALGFGDVDGDGDLDLVVANGSSAGKLQANRLYLNDGKGKFTDVTASRMPNVAAGSWNLGVVDVDLDGDLDLFVGEWQEGARLYLNDGKGRFVDSGSRGSAISKPYANRFVLGDVDADGDEDLLFYDKLFLNLHRQTDARHLARLGYRYQVDFYSQPGYGSSSHFALPFVSPRRANILVSPFGRFGLDPSVTMILDVVPVVKATGVGSIDFVFPPIPALNGTGIFVQALIAPTANSSSWRFTNVNFDVIRSL
jgi:FG-GAP-like repeat